MRLRWLIIIFFCVVVLSSCSSRQLGYRYAESLITWQLNQQVSLTREQRSAVRADLDQFLQWHAENEMPRYLNLLEAIDEALGNGQIDEPQLRVWAEQAESYWLDARQALIPYADRFFQLLSESQKSALISHWRERFEERLVDLDDPDSDRSEVMIARLESSLGRVSSTQKQLARQWQSDSVDNSELWIQYQLHWLDGLTNLLILPAGSNGYHELLQRLFLQPDDWRSEQLNAAISQNEDAGYAFVLALMNTLDQRQRRQLTRELRRWQRDLRGMMRQRGVA
ncbi:MAG: DUF6279 family lipoprotein [Aliidiomarina sp.]|uniref:DUF6279 family lipoprotein n=1 Tax=Aliidiomarina sp. TaxID=1872439 RepID=UPI0025B9075F|nr:DUF6279 family lipoprotein [Aliidiomarina sp.]MCH8501851.1 DUF6279 family lipoprotein [Aliidiomarina sp.]